jgi:transposase-like protein
MWYNRNVPRKSLTKGGIFMPKGKTNKRYTGEFKQKVVETMRREGLSYCETARQFDINDHKSVAAWERIYLEEGKEGLCVERRGKASGTQKGRKPKFDKKVDEDLIDEVQRLRAENAYLKKLNALVAERVRQEKKHK